MEFQPEVIVDNKEKEAQTIVLQVNKDEYEEDTIDLLGIAYNMKNKFRVFFFAFVAAVSIGLIVGALFIAAQMVFGYKGEAVAVVSFSYKGIEKGLNPNGGMMDVSDIKSTEVVNKALENVGLADKNADEIRANITIEGVIPDDIKKQLAVINTVAEKATDYYAKVNDISYFPSQYTVTLKRCQGLSSNQTRELLDAVLMEYKNYFMESYADMSTLSSMIDVLNVEGYDYLQASDVISNEITNMVNFVSAKQAEAGDFRAKSTGLSFGDLKTSIQAVRKLDLNNYISFVQSNNLSKDAGIQIDYYNYQIKEYTLDLKELETQLANVERTIAEYEKDPVIVMSNQDNVAEVAQKNEYYDKLLTDKINLTKEIGSINSEINKARIMIEALNGGYGEATQDEKDYADQLLTGLVENVKSWSDLVQKTTDEYYNSYLYASSYRINMPAQYQSAGGFGDKIKILICFGGGAGVLTMLWWGFVGLKEELTKGRK